MRTEDVQVRTEDLPGCCRRAVNYAECEVGLMLMTAVQCLSCGAMWHVIAPRCWVAHPDMEEILRGEQV